MKQSKTPSVLIVDDEQEIVDTIERFFTLRGITCVKTTSAREAIELHKAQAFPIVLSDVKMPEYDGVALTMIVKQNHPMTQVYIMTGYATLLNIADCLKYGAADFFFKPFYSLEDIGNTIQAAIDRHSRWVKEVVLHEYKAKAA